MYEYLTTGTCSTKIHFDIRDNRVYNVSFENGCNGNLKGIAILTEGMEAGELVKRLKGVQCKTRGTSCPDQLAKAVAQATKTS
ncbi:MAG: TIGR03905 family TSCPD domain-containing protein [Treponema sp.]|nr:TIGR03905 family TSCPD domain-containing protein [Treponema sp.]